MTGSKITLNDALYVHSANSFSFKLPSALSFGQEATVRVTGVNLSYTGFLVFLSSGSSQICVPKYTQFLAGGETFTYGDFDITFSLKVAAFTDQDVSCADSITFLMPKYSLKMMEVIFKSVSVTVNGKETHFSLSDAVFNEGAEYECGKVSYEETDQKLYDIYSRPFNVKDETYEAMINASLVSKGNNFRMKKLLEKIRANKPVYYVPFGGSLTEGGGPASFRDGYAYQFLKKLQAKYNPGKDNIIMVPCGLGGTGSAEGLIRYHSNVIERCGHQPDLLIIEFAVNDEPGPENIRAFEELIRNAMLKNPECAIIALYSAAPYTRTQDEKIPVALHYGIPQISIMDAVNKNNGEFPLDEYSTFYADYVHPSTMGHTIMTDCLMNLVDEIDSAPEDEPNSIPEERKITESPYTNFRFILPDYAPAYSGNPGIKLSAGSFTERDFAPQTQSNDLISYPYNWHRPGRVSDKLKDIPAENDAFKIELTCKNILFIYKAFNCGTAEVLVDGKVEGTLNGSKESWNTSYFKSFINENETRPHTVEVRMASGDEDKPFTIEGIGYSS